MWAGVAGTLVALGGTRGRGAVLRAIAAEAVSSVIANGLVKPLIDRRRPRRRRGRTGQKTSSSFPSSHAASGAAFATVILLDWPAPGVPVGLLSVLVGVSRVYAEQHFIGDVLAGLTIGTTVGATVHAFGQRRDDRAADVASTRQNADLRTCGQPALAEGPSNS